MRHAGRTRSFGPVASLGLLVGLAVAAVVVGPAAAEEESVESGSAAVTVTVSIPERGPGDLIWELDGTEDIVDLGIGTGHGDHVAATGTLDDIRVVDSRVDGAAWTISGQVSDFRNGNIVAPAKYLGWTPFLTDNRLDAVAGPTVASGYDSGEGLSQARTLASGSPANPAGSVRLGAELDFKIPYDLGAGTYHALLTLTALS